MKLTKKDYTYIALLIIIFISLVLFLTNNIYLYGSTLDWYSEHLAIPEYFRTLFYHTKDLFPDFAANIGGGQNIYNLSYYGLLSPIILVSYLLPMIPMTIFIPLSTILSVIASAILLYLFLHKKNYSSEVCFLSSIFLMLSAPMSFHSHRHIMFINYMPFLILGLFGIDKKTDENKGWLLTLSTFLMIMTSYYYSIGGIGCFFVYGLYRYLEKMNKVTLKSFFKTFFNILIPIIVGILCSSIIILPTFATLLYNRASSNVFISIKDLLIPSINTDTIIYHPYGIGLNAIVFFGLINIFKKNKANITLGIILSSLILFNIFNYILNGTMYIDSKSLIPFIPLYIITISEFLKDLFAKKINWLIIIPSIILISIFVYFYEYKVELYIIEVLLILIISLIYNKVPKKQIITIPLIIFTIISSFALNASDGLVLKYTSKHNEEILKNDIGLITTTDDTFYRISNELDKNEYPNRIFDNINYYNGTIYSSISNQNYNQFYYDTLTNNIATRNRALTIYTPNLLSLMLNNNKYIITRSKPLQGYELVNTNDGLNIYKNENVLPYGFATSNVMSYEDFEKLSDQVKQEALLNVIVADAKTNNNFVANTKKVDFDYKKILENDRVTVEEDNSLTIKAPDGLKITYDLPTKYQNKIIFIRFKMNYKSNKDLSITINNVKNKLAASSWKYYNGNELFDYVLASQDQTKLNFTFTEGTYNISDFETYILDYAYIEKVGNNVSKFIVDKEKTKGDNISGHINVVEDSYFMFTIPYDNGFTIKVDDKPITYEKVDNAYIGFKIKEGTHKIEVKYKAPTKNIALFMSLFGFIIFCIITYIESKLKF